MKARAEKPPAYVAPPPRATSVERDEAACVLRRYRERLRLRVALLPGKGAVSSGEGGPFTTGPWSVSALRRGPLAASSTAPRSGAVPSRREPGEEG